MKTMNLTRLIRQGVDPAKLEMTTAGALRGRGEDLPDDLPDDAPVALVPGWWAGDEQVELYFPSVTSAEEAAEEFVEDGDWSTWSTTWVHVKCWRLALVPPPDDPDAEPDEYRLDTQVITITVHPKGPPCVAGHSHEWETPHGVVGGFRETPGVYSHGGGVRQYAVCRWCGTYRIIDTWGQDPVSGVQGLQSVEYAEPDQASLSWLACKEES